MLFRIWTRMMAIASALSDVSFPSVVVIRTSMICLRVAVRRTSRVAAVSPLALIEEQPLRRDRRAFQSACQQERQPGRLARGSTPSC